MTSTTAEKAYKNGKQSADNATDEVIGDRLKSQVEDGIAKTQKALESAAAQTSEELRKAGDQTTKLVRENPAIALAGAVGFGILIGLAMRGRG